MQSMQMERAPVYESNLYSWNSKTRQGFQKDRLYLLSLQILSIWW